MSFPSHRAFTLLLAAGALPLLAVACGGHTFRADTWFNKTVGTEAAWLAWTDVASDSTGTHLVAVTGTGGIESGGDVWTSVDRGATWLNRTQGTPASGQGWASVASDSSGTHLVAATTAWDTNPGGDVWTSADAGATWTKRTTVTSTAHFMLAPTVMSDSTGTHLVVASGDVWTSDDAGATWTDKTAGTSAAGADWVDMASDSTATRLVGVTAYSDIWKSSDAGATWTNVTTGTAASTQQWQAVASDSTGTHLVAVSQQSMASSVAQPGGDIWTSADSGATWVNATKGSAASGHLWWSVASDASGVHLVATTAHESANDVWTSSDSGMTWMNQTAGTDASGAQWEAVASDAAGVHLVAIAGSAGGGPCCMANIWTN